MAYKIASETYAKSVGGSSSSTETNKECTYTKAINTYGCSINSSIINNSTSTRLVVENELVTPNYWKELYYLTVLSWPTSSVLILSLRMRPSYTNSGFPLHWPTTDYDSGDSLAYATMSTEYYCDCDSEVIVDYYDSNYTKLGRTTVSLDGIKFVFDGSTHTALTRNINITLSTTLLLACYIKLYNITESWNPSTSMSGLTWKFKGYLYEDSYVKLPSTGSSSSTEVPYYRFRINFVAEHPFKAGNTEFGNIMPNTRVYAITTMNADSYVGTTTHSAGSVCTSYVVSNSTTSGPTIVEAYNAQYMNTTGPLSLVSGTTYYIAEMDLKTASAGDTAGNYLAITLWGGTQYYLLASRWKPIGTFTFDGSYTYDINWQTEDTSLKFSVTLPSSWPTYVDSNGVTLKSTIYMYLYYYRANESPSSRTSITGNPWYGNCLGAYTSNTGKFTYSLENNVYPRSFRIYCCGSLEKLIVDLENYTYGNFTYDLNNYTLK